MKKYALLFLCLGCFFYSVAQDKKIDSLSALLPSAKEDQKAKILLKLASLTSKNDPLKAKEYLEKVFVALEKNPHDSTMVRALNLMTIAARRSADYKKAKDYGYRAIEFAQKIKDSTMWAISLNSMANIFLDEGAYDKALEFYFESYRIQELVGNVEKMGTALLGISNSYFLQKKYDKALEYYDKTYDHWKKYGNKKEMANALNGKGSVLLDLKEFKKAIVEYEEALKLASEINDEDVMALTYLNIGNVYGYAGDFKKCIDYFERAAVIREKTNDLFHLSQILNNIGTAYFLMRDYKKAEDYMIRSLEMARKINAQHLIVKGSGDLSELYSKSGNFEKAYDYLSDFVHINDSLHSQENKQKIDELQTRYETKEKEKQIELLNKDKAIQDAELNKQKIINLSVIIGLILFALLSYFIFRGYRQKQKANTQLQKAYKVIEEKSFMVEEKNKEILDSIHYAKRIQGALLATVSLLDSNLQEHFVFYKPKDIVSGDFYWASARNNKFFLCVADSTGHGVPGAFMSLLNISFLNEAVNEKEMSQPGHVFDHVRKRLIENISQEGQKDGMDAILVCFENGKGNASPTLTYSAAHNAPLLVSEGKATELEYNKMPVGISETAETFRTYTVNAKKGDVLYLYTDGYADQFGGPKGKKFKYKTLIEKLLEISRLPFQDQKHHLEKSFDDWKGNLEQVDDVCIIGIRL